MVHTNLNALSKDAARALLQRQADRIARLRGKDYRCPDLEPWRRQTLRIVERIFGKDSDQVTQFGDVEFGLIAGEIYTTPQEWQKAYDRGLDKTEATLKSFDEELDLLEPIGVITSKTKQGTPSGKDQKWDLFICHASEDKDDVALPLADALIAKGLRVWYDDFELTVGDSLSSKIDEGLAKSSFGVVILSPSFFSKHWTRTELEGLRAKEISSGKTILPVWHNVCREYVLGYSPVLADKLAVSTKDGLNKIVDEVLKAVRKDESFEKRSEKVTPSISGRSVAIRSSREPPKITFVHLILLTYRQLVTKAVLSAFLTAISAALLTTEQFNVVRYPIIAVGCIISLIAIFRNRLLRLIFRERRFDTHCKWTNRLIPPLIAAYSMFLGLLFGSSYLPERAVSGPILAFGFVAIAIGLAIGQILSDKGKASLLFEQCAFEIRSGTDFAQAFVWLDRGLYVLRRILKKYGHSVHLPTVRLGAKLDCTEKREETTILDDLSQAILHVEDPGQLKTVRKIIESLHETGEEAISKGMPPDARLTDYLEYRYLSLRNLYYIVMIISALVGILIAVTSRIPLR